MKILILGLLLTVYLTVVKSYTPIKYITSYCGQTINVDESIILKLSASYYPPKDCTVNIQALDAGQTNILMQASFQSFDLSCNDGNVALYPTVGSQQALVTACGFKPSGNYRSVGDTMKIRLYTDRYFDGNFEILLTMLNNGACQSWEFMCDNLYCIDSSLTCNGYDNCGDNSDESTDKCFWSVNTISGMAVGAVVAFIIFLVIIVVVCRRRHGHTVYNSGCGPSVVTNFYQQQKQYGTTYPQQQQYGTVYPQQPQYGYAQPPAYQQTESTPIKS